MRKMTEDEWRQAIRRGERFARGYRGLIIALNKGVLNGANVLNRLRLSGFDDEYDSFLKGVFAAKKEFWR